MNNDKPYTIEKGIPIPIKMPRGYRSALSLALQQMEVGDSIIMTQRERNAAFATAHQMNIKLASRRINNEEDSIRVWRTA